MQHIIEPRLDLVPAELTSLDQWVVWKAVPSKKKPGKFTKVPYHPVTKRQASSTKAKDWGTFHQAVEAYISGTEFDGIGFVFSQNDDIIGIDLDGCFNEDGSLTEEALFAVDTMKSYTERSPSGNGLHIICRGRLPGAGHCDKTNGREMYQEGRFFTITANIVNGLGKVIERKEQVREIYERWWGTDSVKDYNAGNLTWNKDEKIQTVDQLNISDYTKHLITNGEGMDDFLSNEGEQDRSNAMFYATREMVAAGASKETILSILTDKTNFLAQPAIERRGSRKSAIQWVWKYTVAKLVTQHDEEKDLFDELVEEEIAEEDDEENPDDVFEEHPDKEPDEKIASKDIAYVKNNFERNALLFLKSAVPLVRFQEEYYKYSGKHWIIYDDELVARDVQIAIRGRAFSMAQINNMITTVKRFSTKESFSPSPTTIAFKNGIVDLAGWDYGLIDGTLMPHDPSYKTMSLLDFNYNIDASCPIWINFLDEVFEGDQERIRLLKQYIGYILVFDYRWQKLLVMAGESRSGKGTIANIIYHLVGKDSYVGTSISKLGGEHGLHSLIAAKVAVIGDAKQAARGGINQSHEALLNITGNDVVTISRKYKSDLSMRIPARLIMMANDVPRFSDSADAMFNRYAVLAFNVSFAGREDVDLSDKLRGELPGIFNWAVEGLLDLSEAGKFIETATGQAKANEMRVFNNPVGSFAELFLQPGKGKGEQVRTDDVFNMYERFCQGIDIKATNKIDFTRKLLKHIPWTKVVRNSDADRTKMYHDMKVDYEKLSEYTTINF